MLTKRPRGTADILPGQVEKWRFIEDTMGALCREYNFKEIRTPVFEHTELFVRGVGEDTDIVEKEMYTFIDRGDRSITLRPEGTAPAVRAYLENKLNAGTQPVKLYYSGPMFRYDRPQAGRYRQFHQLGVEVFGSHDPAVDAEVMTMAMEFYSRLGLKGMELHINSVGCPECRRGLRKELEDYFQPRLDNLCNDCRIRLEKKPLRILDCKNPRCHEAGKNAPTTLVCLCPECRDHFDAVCKYLELLNIPYVVDNRLVRGLDYYTHTAFEIMAPGIGAQSSVGGGGRYNGLVEECGGPPVPGIGYALGVERIILAMESQGVEISGLQGPEVFVVVLSAGNKVDGLEILFRLRREGIKADQDYMGRSLKAQMKYASKCGARFTLLVGGEEWARGCALLREMATGEQREVPLDKIADQIKQQLGRLP